MRVNRHGMPVMECRPPHQLSAVVHARQLELDKTNTYWDTYVSQQYIRDGEKRQKALARVRGKTIHQGERTNIMAIGKHYQKYLDERAKLGFTAHEAAGMSGAIQAAELDRVELAKTQRSRSTEEFLGLDADKPFVSAQQRQNAFAARDAQGKKLYENPAYRKAIEHKLSLSSDEVAGYQNPMANVPTEADMVRAAEEELYTARRQELFHKSASKDPVVAAQARYDLIAFHQAPEIRRSWNGSNVQRWRRSHFSMN